MAHIQGLDNKFEFKFKECALQCTSDSLITYQGYEKRNKMKVSHITYIYKKREKRILHLREQKLANKRFDYLWSMYTNKIKADLNG